MGAKFKFALHSERNALYFLVNQNRKEKLFVCDERDFLISANYWALWLKQAEWLRIKSSFSHPHLTFCFSCCYYYCACITSKNYKESHRLHRWLTFNNQRQRRRMKPNNNYSLVNGASR